MTEVIDLLAKYRRKGILIDTNILLLYLVGRVNRERISRFKRTAQFLAQDYELLVQITDGFQQIITTPHILTEVNSLANQLGEPERTKCLGIYTQLVLQLTEEYIESTTISKHELFSRFGLTDCGIILTAKDKYLVLTDDLKLHLYLKALEIDTINFNNLRSL